MSAQWRVRVAVWPVALTKVTSAVAAVSSMLVMVPMLRRSHALTSLADGDVAGGVLETGETVSYPIRVVADEACGLQFDRTGVVGPALQCGVVEGGGGVLDRRGVGVAGVGELFAARGAEPVDELLVEGVGVFAGEGEGAVVAGEVVVEVVEFGLGDDEPVGVAAA